MIEMRVEQFYY